MTNPDSNGSPLRSSGLSRRAFVLGSVAVAGGVAIGYRYFESRSPALPLELSPGQAALTPYVVIDRNGITVITPRAEMGQGIHTGLAALVAEELDVPFADLKTKHGPASMVYRNDKMGGVGQLTGGQTSTRDGFVKMRKAGAAARLLLIEAAAKRLGVEPVTLTTNNGRVVSADGTAISYTELAEEAALLEAPEDPPLKKPDDWHLLGTSLPRVDAASKCTGAALYAADLRLPGLLFATVKRNPHLGGSLNRFDASRAQTMTGVEKIVALPGGVLVIATTTWYALQAAETIEFDWGPAPYPPDTAGHRQAVESAFDGELYYRARDDGDTERALREGDVIAGHYAVPYLAHATMEPLSATARLADGRLDIWAGMQWPTKALDMAAELSGLRTRDIRIHTLYMGGGFGRRLELDHVFAAVHAAMAMPGRPVAVAYSREEDMQHDTYRPMASARFQATVRDGRPQALRLDLSAPSLFYSASIRDVAQSGFKEQPPPDMDVSITMGARDQKYQIANYQVTAYRPPELLPVGWWRGVGESQNTFFLESILDELAFAAGTDPLEMRLALLQHEPSRAVLESVADMSGWGTPLPEGHARGLAYAISSRAASALVMQIRHEDGAILLERAYAALDVGFALDPGNIEAQMQSSLLWGLESAIYGEITVREGTVEQRNFDDYPVLRMPQVPDIEVRIHASREAIFGVGESMTPTAAPALGNAIFAATGRRIRELPFSKALRFPAMGNT